MTDLITPSEPEIRIEANANEAWSRVDLMLDEKSVSRLWLRHLTIHIGEALVRMDGIGGVGTDTEFRNRGYSRRVIEASVEHMAGTDAELSMLYGIRDFYPKFGFATAGPDHLIILTDLERDSALPQGWSVRPFAPEDIGAVQALYSQGTRLGTGAAVRPPKWAVWSRLLDAPSDANDDDCRLVTDPQGTVRGYLWRANWCWYVKNALEPEFPKALVIGEAMADGPAAADAVLAGCRLLAREAAPERELTEVVLACPPSDTISAAAMRQDARLVRNYSACGGSMARVVDVGRLLKALAPELETRLHAAKCEFQTEVIFQTEIGSATIRIDSGHVVMDGETLPAAVAGETPALPGLPLFPLTPSPSHPLIINLPQAELARLALGAFPPADILARLPDPPQAEESRLLEILFPVREPHMHLPDRY